MATFEDAYQLAVYTALAGNVVVDGITVPVHDFVKQEQVKAYTEAAPPTPWIVLGTMQAVPATDKDDNDQDLYLTVDIWSRQRGKRQTHDIMSAVHTLLHRQALSLGSGTLIQLVADSPTQALLDRDGLTYHGVMTWRAHVQS